VKNMSRVVIQNNDFDAITPFADGVELSTFNMKENRFNYEGLEPIKTYTLDNDLIPVDYENQQETEQPDTILITENTTLTLSAGDEHPLTTYQWYKDFEIMDGETNSELILNVQGQEEDGKYYCKMNNVDFPYLELERSLVVVEVDIPLSSSDVSKMEYQVFPNPTKDYINVKFDFNISDVTFNIYSISGKKMKTGKLNNKEFINIGEFMEGIYYLELNAGDAIFTKRIVKI